MVTPTYLPDVGVTGSLRLGSISDSWPENPSLNMAEPTLVVIPGTDEYHTRVGTAANRIVSYYEAFHSQ